MTYQLIYPDYKDLATGKTLVVTPGSSYTIAVAPGRNPGTPAIPNDGRWTAQAAFQSMFRLFGEPDQQEATPVVSGTGAGAGTAKTVTKPEPGGAGEGEA